MLDFAHILVIDDDPTILDLLSDILVLSYHVSVENDSSRGAERVCSEMFDLFILDLEMPLLDGFEFIRRARACPTFADTPILVLSARPDLRTTLRDAPVQGKMEKPFSIGKLVSAVEQLLQNSGERVMQ